MRGRLATRGNTSVMNLQTFPGDFLFKFRPDLGPADSAATTSSTVVYADQQGRLHRPGGKEDSQHKIRGGDLHPAAVTSLINLGLGGTGLAQTTARSGWTASSH
jgi:hypothetical protein